VRLHWTLPVGLVALGGFAFVPVFWVALVGLLMVHELGHAVIALRYGHRVTAIEVTGFGGVCRWEGDTTEDERGAIAWGGVTAQALVAASTELIITWTGEPESSVGLQLLRALIHVNLLLIAVNLLPIGSLDGKEAWSWVVRLIRRRRSQSAVRNHVDVDAMLEVIDAPEIEPPRPPASSKPRIRGTFEPMPAPRPRAELCSSDEELARLLKAIADEAAEKHRLRESA
jgi:hypothetical protein